MELQSVPVIVVITEDDELRSSLTDLIESRNIGAVIQRFAEDVLDQRQVHSGICLIVDVGVGKSVGIDLVRKLREDGDEIPVILVARHVDPVIQDAARAVDAIALLAIPVPPLVLFAALDEALSSS
jgi:two-component system response regulator FixJ